MIVVKSGIKNLPLFQNTDFEYFEAYTGHDDDLRKLLNTHMKMKVIHLASKISIKGRLHSFNLNDHGDVGAQSWNKLLEAVVFANNYGIGHIVVHVGFFNIDKEKKNDVIERIASRLNELDTGSVKICLENVPHWINLSFDNEPIISACQDMEFFRSKCPSAGFVVDVDHIAIDTVFNWFLAFHKSRCSDVSTIRENLGESLFDLHKYPQFHFSSLISQGISEYFDSITPDIVHAVGSDYCNYFTPKALPLIGEGLPLQYKGEINGYQVEDRIDHSLWIRKIRPSTIVTVELLMREDYGYVDQIQRSIDIINRLQGGVSQ